MTSSSLSNILSVSSFLSRTKPPPPLHLPRAMPKSNSFISLATAQEQRLPGGLSAVINPSLAYSNTLYLRGYNVQVVVDDNEPEERLLNRFRREVMRAGVIQECKRRRFFENKQDEKKRKSREAAKRNRRRRPQFRATQTNKPEESMGKKSEDDEDNWDLPEDDVPY